MWTGLYSLHPSQVLINLLTLPGLWRLSSSVHYYICLFVMFAWCLIALSAQIGYIVPQKYKYILYVPGTIETYLAIKQWKNTTNQDNQTLFSVGFMEMIPSPWLGFLRGVFLANHLASNDYLTRTTKRQNTYPRKLTIHKKGPNKQRYKVEHAKIYDRQS